jgi:Uma2 family endonuclease
MSVITESAPIANGRAAIPTDYIWRLTVEQYHQMIQAGILDEDDPVELLEGWLVYKMAKNPPHRVVTGLIREAVSRLLPPGWFIDTQEPLTTEDSEPEPDITVIRGDQRDYVDHHPGPQEVALLVEVADSSLRRDREWKKRIYAEARVPVYWVVNLPKRQIEVYADPSGPAEHPDYRQCQTFTEAEEVPVVIDGREVGRLPMRELLP